MRVIVEYEDELFALVEPQYAEHQRGACEMCPFHHYQCIEQMGFLCGPGAKLLNLTLYRWEKLCDSS